MGHEVVGWGGSCRVGWGGVGHVGVGWGGSGKLTSFEDMTSI